MTRTEFYLLAARRSALKLELKGLRNSSGRSVYALCKRAYGLRGSRQAVLDQMQALVDAALAAAGPHHDDIR